MRWSQLFLLDKEKSKKFKSTDLDEFKTFMNELYPQIKPSGSIGRWIWVDKDDNYYGEAVAKTLDKWECRYYEK